MRGARAAPLRPKIKLAVRKRQGSVKARSRWVAHSRPARTGGTAMATTSQASFDPMKYKETTRAQWQDAAAAWNEWSPLLRA